MSKKNVMSANSSSPLQAVSIIVPLEMGMAEISIRGTAPLLVHRFSSKAQGAIRGTQEAGSVAKGKKIRAPRDFEADMQAARYISEEGWDGINASGFRKALVSACRGAQFVMTKGKAGLFIVADGRDKIDGTPLVKVIDPDTGKPAKPELDIRPVRNSSGVMDLRARPIYKNWGAKLRVKWDATMFSHDDIVNLLLRAGIQVGICEGRPDSKQSCGIDMGTWEIPATGRREQK